MSLTFAEIEQVKDEELFIVSGKALKELLAVTRQARWGPGRVHYQWGGQLTAIVCSAQRCPDIEALVSGLKKEV